MLLSCPTNKSLSEEEKRAKVREAKEGGLSLDTEVKVKVSFDIEASYSSVDEEITMTLKEYQEFVESSHKYEIFEFVDLDIGDAEVDFLYVTKVELVEVDE